MLMDQLSNPFNKSATGLEIMDWVWYHSNNKTGYTEIAKTLNHAFNLDKDKYYMMKKCGKEIKIVEVEKKGKKYEVPCDN